MDDEVTALFKNHDTNERDENGQRKRKYNHSDYFKKTFKKLQAKKRFHFSSKNYNLYDLKL